MAIMYVGTRLPLRIVLADSELMRKYTDILKLSMILATLCIVLPPTPDITPLRVVLVGPSMAPSAGQISSL